jgi:hypothetical protein
VGSGQDSSFSIAFVELVEQLTSRPLDELVRTAYDKSLGTLYNLDAMDRALIMSNNGLDYRLQDWGCGVMREQRPKRMQFVKNLVKASLDGFSGTGELLPLGCAVLCCCSRAP